VSGKDRRDCFVYRTIETRGDHGRGARSKSAVVIGGGLLGSKPQGAPILRRRDRPNRRRFRLALRRDSTMWVALADLEAWRLEAEQAAGR